MRAGKSFYNDEDENDIGGIELFESLQDQFDKERKVLKSAI